MLFLFIEMLKFIVSTQLFLFFSTVSLAQIDAYYEGTDSLFGDSLKLVLHDIIDDHKSYPYSSKSTDVWDILKVSDRDTSNAENVLLFYTGWSVNAAQEYNKGKGWNREHVWAKSRGDFGTSKGAGTDCHHIRAADVSVNSARNNRWFAIADQAYVDGKDTTLCKTSNTQWIWEPRDEVKGDVARMLFYMVVRYEGENGEPDLELVNYLPEDKLTKEPIYAILDVLIQWHLSDPVDSIERIRNNVVFEYQGNRNPFIDHPEFVCRIWTESCAEYGENLPLKTPKNVQSTNLTHQHATINWEEPTGGVSVNEYAVYLNGQLFTTVPDTSLNISFLLPETTYLVEIEAVSYFYLHSPKASHSFTTLSLSALLDDLEKQG